MGKKQNYVIAKDVIFGMLIHDDYAEVVAEQGVVGLFTQSDRKFRAVPDNIELPTDCYGQTLSVIVREVTDSIILERGPDDFYESELSDRSKVMAINSTRDVEELFNELKIQSFTRTAGTIATFIAGVVMSVVGWLLLQKGFVFPILAEVSLCAGLPIGVVFGLIPFVRLIQRLNCDYIADPKGHWVNIKTGKTNMNGGIVIPTGG